MTVQVRIVCEWGTRIWKCFYSRGECTNVWRDSHLRRRLLSVSLSPTLSRNEIVEQHIKKKTHTPNALRFWIENDVILLYGLTFVSFLWDHPRILSVIYIYILEEIEEIWGWVVLLVLFNYSNFFFIMENPTILLLDIIQMPALLLVYLKGERKLSTLTKIKQNRGWVLRNQLVIQKSGLRAFW